MGGLARPHRPRLLSHLSGARFFQASKDPIAVLGVVFFLVSKDPIAVLGVVCGSRSKDPIAVLGVVCTIGSTHLFGRAKWGCERS